jgi:hypothetical protein
MLKGMLSSTLIESDATLFIAQTNPAKAVPSSFEGQDYEGWSGLMENLASEELEFLTELVVGYLEEHDDLNHTEFGFAKGVLDKIEEAMDV